MHETTLIAQTHVASNKHIIGNSLPEDFHTQYICDDLLGLSFKIWVDQRNVIVRNDDVSKRTQPLLDSLNPDRVGKGVAEVLQLLVRGRGGDEETFAVAGGEAADDAGACDGSADGGDDVLKLGLEDGVEVLGGAESDEGVGVCEGREDTDPRSSCQLGFCSA